MKFGCFGTQQLFMLHRIMTKSGVRDRDTVKHCIYDNCDDEILSPNCKQCFHCLALTMAQVRSPSISSPAELDPLQKTIKRQPMQDRSKPVKYDVQQVTYNGSKKPLMTPITSCPLRTSSIAISSQAITKQ